MKPEILTIKMAAMRTKTFKSQRLFRWSVTALAILAAAGWLLAEGGAIGMATVNGAFEADHASVRSTATLFDGTTIETRVASSDLRLNSGVQLRLAAASRATVYRNRMVLESGLGQLNSAGPYEIGARSLRISATHDTIARVRLDEENKVTVAVVRGGVRVANAAGLLVAEIAAGTSLDFEPQAAGASAPTRAAGCLLAKSGKLILVEQTTNVVLEVHGAGLEPELGNRLEIAGLAEPQAPSVAGASQVIKVAGLKRIATGGCKTVARKAGAAVAVTASTAAGATGAAAAGSGAGAGAAGAAGAAAAAAGIGVGTVAVIGGVAAAATVGGLAAVGDLPGQSESPPSASR
jgi:hypothetical protein